MMLITNIDTWKEVTCRIQLPLVLCYYNSTKSFIYSRQIFENYSRLFLNISLPDNEHYEKENDPNHSVSFIQLCNPVLHLKLCHDFQTLCLNY